MSDRLKITFVLPGRGLAGGTRVVAIYANRLLERGHNVTIVCQCQPLSGRPRAAYKRLREDVRRAFGLDRDHLDGFHGRLRFAPSDRLEDVVPEGDILIATHCLTANATANLPANRGAKHYFLQHYEAHTFDKDLVDTTWRLPMQKIVIARWLQRLAIDQFGDPSAVLVPNGVDLEQFNAPPRDAHRPPCVGFVFARAQWKGSAVAAEAIRIARRTISDLRVVSFGKNRPDAQMPLPPNTEFHYRPAQQRIRDIYASADVWLCPSESEGFALPPLEAMACRCPVVSTRCGGPEDFVEDGMSGYLVEVGDAATMAQRLVAILRDGDILRRMSKTAFNARLRYNWGRSTDLFESAIIASVLPLDDCQSVRQSCGKG